MKGYIRTLESLLAGMIILGFLVFLPKPSVIHSCNPSEKAYQILESLEDRGVLREYVASMDYEGLNSQIHIYTYNHSVQICDFSGCAGQPPSSSNTWTGSYFISGKNTSHPYLIKLYLWEK